MEIFSLSDCRWERSDVEAVVFDVRMVRFGLFLFDLVETEAGLSTASCLVDLMADLATSDGSFERDVGTKKGSVHER